MVRVKRLKHEFKVGQMAILDSRYPTKSHVVIHDFTTTKLFAIIKDEHEPDKFKQVLTVRLTPVLRLYKCQFCDRKAFYTLYSNYFCGRHYRQMIKKQL